MELCKSPNQHTKKPSFSADGRTATITGYQTYQLTKVSITPRGSRKKTAKAELMRKILPELSDKSILDLGCANGYYCFSALYAGARHVTGIDMDPAHIAVMKQAIDYFRLKHIDVFNNDVNETLIHLPPSTYNIVFALALIHWIYSCTSTFGSIDAIMRSLAEITGEMLIIEWISPKDDNIQMFGHLDYNTECIQAAYNKTNFTRALKKYFSSHTLLGRYADNREIYKAVK